MNENILLTVVLFAGIALGIVFFGGLWFTVKKAVTMKGPALWVLGSFVVRVAIVLIGFYLAGAGDWRRLIICLIGFIAARFIVIQFTKTIEAKMLRLKTENTHGA